MAIEDKLQAIDGRLDTIDGRLDTVDGRLDTIVGRLEAMDDRLADGQAFIIQTPDRYSTDLRKSSEQDRRFFEVLIEQHRHEVQVARSRWLRSLSGRASGPAGWFVEARAST